MPRLIVVRAVVSVGVVVVSMALSSAAFPQAPNLVKYCNDLVATYRKAVADGAAPQPQMAEAAANCPTNPNGSIPTLEKTLKDMKVTLPPR